MSGATRQAPYHKCKLLPEEMGSQLLYWPQPIDSVTPQVTPNNCGVFQGAVFLTPQISDLLSELLVSFLKYANDVIIGHLCRDSQGISIVNNALEYVSQWSGENGLQNLKPTISGSALSTVEPVTYLGVTSSTNAKLRKFFENVCASC